MSQTQSSDAIEHYHDLLARHHLESTAEALARATERQGLAFGERPVCTVLRPFFIHEARYEFVRGSSALVMRGVAQLGERLMKDDSLRKGLGLTPEEDEIARIATGYGAPDVSARLDGFVSPEGDFNFVEYNAESPGGLAYGDALADAFKAMPIMEDFARRYSLRAPPIRDLVFDALTSAYRRWGGKGLPNIAIIDWRGVGTYSEFLLMKERFESRGCRVRIADPAEVEYGRGRLRVEDFEVDLVYKRVVIGELMARYGLKHPIIEAVRNGDVCMANGFGVQMLYKKALFALLSDPAHEQVFEPEVAAALARHIPWTRIVREAKTVHRGRPIDLLPFVAENRERLVLKPNGEYGGKGVTLGWECDQQSWESAIKGALNGSYIVQERVPMGRETYPAIIGGGLRFDERYLDLDPYVWNGTGVEGCGVRLSSAALLNVSAGGGSAIPMFIIRDK